MKQSDKGSVATGILATILGIILLVGIVVGGYAAGWWLKEDAVNRNARIDQGSYSRQEALTAAVLDDISEAQDPNLPEAQVRALVDQICDNAAKLTGSIQLPNNAQVFIARECGL